MISSGGKRSGFYRPLSDADQKRIIDEAIGLLNRSGMRVYSATARNYLDKAGAGGDFLAREHTVLHMYDEFFNPRLSDRSSYADWISSGHSDMKKNARKKLRELIASHNPCYINEAKEKEIRSAFPEIRD